MYSLSELTREIDEVILGLEAANAPKLHPDWITQMVMNHHPDVTGTDADFYQCVSRTTVRDAVRGRLNRYKAKPELSVDKQIVLEGFERLQKHYLVDEDGTQVAIRVQDLADAQLEMKAIELRAMGAGCYQHADEIERYRQQRLTAA